MANFVEVFGAIADSAEVLKTGGMLAGRAALAAYLKSAVMMLVRSCLRSFGAGECFPSKWRRTMMVLQ